MVSFCLLFPNVFQCFTSGPGHYNLFQFNLWNDEGKLIVDYPTTPNAKSRVALLVINITAPNTN